jgi:hypothetical protein
VDDLPDVLPAVAGESNVYLSTQRFHGWRRISKLASCGALAVDLDYYRMPELRGMEPERVLETAMIALEAARIPAPALAIASGRGLYLLWFHSPIPRQALTRWNACQRTLYEALKPLGADRAALDAARVLRLVGTRHAGTGAMVRALAGGAGGDAGEVWDFDALAHEVLPVGRGELHDLRVHRAARDARRPRERPRGTPEGYTAATLWEARLSDLQRLRELRWFDGEMTDYRDRWLFIAGVAMGWLAVPAVLQRELHALAREVGGWTEGKTRSKMHAVFRTAHAASRGERVEWQGVQVDPRYRMKNATVLDWLEITPEEEREMTTLISDDERRRRWRERREAGRRAAGAVKREKYLQTAAARREQVRTLRSEEGMTLRRIAEITGSSLSHVQRISSLSAKKTEQLQTTEKPIPIMCPMSVPLYGGETVPKGLPKALAAPPPRSLPPTPERPPDWHAHPLACECDECLYPAPRYAQRRR